jgi:hypothetical protein
VPIFFSKCGAQSSAAIYPPDFVVGFRPSGRVESCAVGLATPPLETVPNDRRVILLTGQCTESMNIPLCDLQVASGRLEFLLRANLAEYGCEQDRHAHPSDDVNERIDFQPQHLD